MKKWLIFLVILGFFASCTVQKKMYAWSDYKEVLSAYTEKPNEKTRIALEECIQRVISESRVQKRKVPPGIYLQYAELLMEDGKYELAKQYYILEKSYYPESTIITNELGSKLK